MKTLENKINEMKEALRASTTPRCFYKNRPFGCPMRTMMDSRFVALCVGIDLYHAFVDGLIGNNAHEGSIINNCKDVSEYLIFDN